MSESPNLSSSYLGLQLPHPFIVGASPLADTLDSVRQLEDAGSAAIVMRSLFEEQITATETGRIRHMDPFDKQFATVLSYFPAPDRYIFGPVEYLEHLRRIKTAVSIPVVASLNGTSAETWLMFTRQLEQAGANAVELNTYEVVADLNQAGTSVERDMVAAVGDLKRDLAIPIALKLSPYFTSFGNLARGLDQAGVDGLVLFNRFYQADFDIDTLTVTPRLELSRSPELLLRLRWLAILHGRVRASLGVCGGIAEPADAVKAILAGADAVQMVSAVLRRGPSYLGVMRKGLSDWMDAHAFTTLDAVRGKLSLVNIPDPDAFERASYLNTLVGWNGASPDTDAGEPRG
jgi:dihydroorotate dehydrogenase (fumarate)